MYCSKCGAENSEGAKFCSQCGAQLAVTTTQPAEGTPKPEVESSTGLAANTAGLLCYVLGLVTGIIFVVWEKKSTFVKFHAWQSIMTFGVLAVVYLVISTMLGAIAAVTFSPGLAIFATVIGWIIGIVFFILWITLMIQAGSGKMWKVPGAGNWAERQANK
jgi:uncharacterized membrane protein